MTNKSAAERARIVDECMAYQPREMQGSILMEPSGAHRVELCQMGTHYRLELSLGEAIEARKILDQGIADLQFEEGRQRDVERRFRRPVVLR